MAEGVVTGAAVVAVGTLCPAPPRQLAAPPPPSHCCPRPRASATLDPGPCHPSHLTLLWGWHREEAELGPGWCRTPRNRRESETSGALPEPVALGGCLSGAGPSHCQLGSSEVRHRGACRERPSVDLEHTPQAARRHSWGCLQAPRSWQEPCPPRYRTWHLCSLHP